MIDRSTSGRGIAALRLVIGLAQGGILWALYRRPDWFTVPELSTALVVFAMCVPPMATIGLGKLRPRVWILWMTFAAVLCLGLGYHAGYRDPLLVPLRERFFYFFSALNGYVAFLLFIGHSLVVAGDSERRWIATFPTYFDIAWRHATQFALAALFTALFFGFLFLGAVLFELIKLTFLHTLLQSDWFWIPAMAASFAAAIHLTDTLIAAVRAARTLMLSLLSWLLPLMTLIVVGFLFALPFTGLEPLWATRNATWTLIASAIALIVLINSHFQDGRADGQSTALVINARAIAALSLFPLTVLAAVGLSLRVEQYGWTPARIIALAFIVAVGCHAAGYFIAAIRSRTALPSLPQTNVLSAFVIVTMLIALLTPICDPARLAVASQVSQLERGTIDASRFDYGFLHFNTGRYGKAALERLKNEPSGPAAVQVAELASRELRRLGPSEHAEVEATPTGRKQAITVVYPHGAALPESFLQSDWQRKDPQVPPCLRVDGERCDGLLVDLDGDGRTEILLIPATRYKEVFFSQNVPAVSGRGEAAC